MKYPPASLTPFLAALLCIRRKMHILSEPSEPKHDQPSARASIACALLNSLVALFSAPVLSFQWLAHSLTKTPGGWGIPIRLLAFHGSCFLSVMVANRSISVLSVPLWQNKSPFFPVWVPGRLISVFSVPLWQKNRQHPPPDLHNFGAPINTFRMNTCKSVSKQRTLSPFRMNTCEKRGEGAPHGCAVTVGSARSPLCVLCASVANHAWPFPVLS
jgi:hypothetical protein